MENYSIYDNGDGGQLFIQNNDIQKSGGLGVAVCLKLFGGNVDASTTGQEVSGEIRKDWWGNNRFDTSRKWINSETERVLRGASLTDQSLIDIEEAVKTDLESLKIFGEISVSVAYPGLNRVSIAITIKQVAQDAEILVVWDATKNEIIQNIEI